MDESDIVPQENKESVRMTFKATMEGRSDTKTVLGATEDGGHRKLLWYPEDSIGVYNTSEGRLAKFVNVNSETAELGIFDGLAGEDDTYYAVYPYNKDFSYERWSRYFTIDLPSVQKYAHDSFGSDMNPMVAKASHGEDFHFMNICGILVIRLTGDETVKSISVTARDANGNVAKIAGSHTVSMDFIEAPVLTATDNSKGMVTIDCGDGVALNASEPVPFHVVLPPATYSSILVTVSTVDGKVMIKEGKNPLTIHRSEYISAGTLSYSAELSFDLSSKGTANCYIVSEMGAYSFNACTIGNDVFGLEKFIASGQNPHNDDASIAPSSAELLWTDHEGMIAGVSYDAVNQRINFVATGEHGNALIAAKDAEGTILWSWHIWATEKPQEHFYVNSAGTFTVLDRNIGATRADRGSTELERLESVGTMYQWGRKDPFRAAPFMNKDGWLDWKKLFTSDTRQHSLTKLVQSPTTFISYNWNWDNSGNTGILWSTDSKTVYDPCPVGYRVAVQNIWTGFTTDENGIDGANADNLSEIHYSGNFDKGWNFLYDGRNSAWYPTTTYINNWSDFVNSEAEGHLWSANERASLHFWNNDSKYYVNQDYYDHVNAYPVRCMKDEATPSLIVQIGDMKEVNSTDATATGNVAVYGDMEVTESGFVVGSSAEITLSDGTRFTSDKNSGKISALITGLSPLQRYYVRAFATNADGTVYSEARSFLTPNNDGIVDLSAVGTANCYIVQPAYSTYSFRTVKGNSNESVGAAVSAEVLWETYNTADAVTQNSVIASAELKDNKVQFVLPENSVPGNAVIAVRDAGGTILWSWHIWVVDFDPEATQQTYISGAVMMDRNLGALDISAGNVKSYGMFYQWGRKDPFPSAIDDWNFATTYPADSKFYLDSYDSMDYTYQNPTTVISNGTWNSANDLWKPNKTINDPCPHGWRVPDGWEIWDSSIFSFDYQTGTTVNMSDYTVNLPAGGYTDGSYSIHWHKWGGYYYTCKSESDVFAEALKAGDGNFTDASVNKKCEMHIRCMKDTGINVGGNEGYGESEDYEW